MKIIVKALAFSGVLCYTDIVFLCTLKGAFPISIRHSGSGRTNLWLPCLAALIAAAAIFACIAYRGIHIYGAPVHTDATCFSDGADYRICSLCGKAIVTDTYPAQGHSFDNWTVIAEPDLINSGVELSTCTRCGAERKRTVPCLAEQLSGALPRLEITASAAGVSTENAIPCNYRCSLGDADVSGIFMLRYLPPEDQSPHDYVLNIASNDIKPGAALPKLAFFEEENELYARADHEDPLHIRTSALAELFAGAASAAGEPYASLLTLPGGIGFFGTTVAFYQNNIYLEPRTVSFSPAAYCGQHPDIVSAVTMDGGTPVSVYGEGADELFRQALDEAANGQFGAFDTKALAAYLIFRDAVRLNGALGDGTFWVCRSGGTWYPLPVTLESALGVGSTESGLCAPAAEPIDTPSDAGNVLWNAVRTELAPQLDEMRKTLYRDALSPDTVASQLHKTADTFPAELAEQARNADAEALKAQGGSIQDIIEWYRARTDGKQVNQ